MGMQGCSRVTPVFLQGETGLLFAIHHKPPADLRCKGTLICAMPFNEEMNRCRSRTFHTELSEVSMEENSPYAAIIRNTILIVDTAFELNPYTKPWI